jgi:hypothetical protein
LGADDSPHNSNTKLDVGFYSPEARTSINRCVPRVSPGFQCSSNMQPSTLSSSIPPLIYNGLGSPLADLSSSHPLTVGAPDRGDYELVVQRMASRSDDCISQDGGAPRFFSSRPPDETPVSSCGGDLVLRWKTCIASVKLLGRFIFLFPFFSDIICPFYVIIIIIFMSWTILIC